MSTPTQKTPFGSHENKIVLRGINKTFGKNKVLRNIGIEMSAGDFLTIVGPSGCGKSTLLRVIAGLESQDSGSILMGGAVLDDMPPKKRDVAMVFQSYALYPHLTVFDNIAVPLRMRNLSLLQRLPVVHHFLPATKTIKREIFRQVEEISRTLDIEELVDRKPNQLSGGQKQRVALGRAMVRKPKVFLMDEPLSNLDAKLRVSMRSEIAQLHRRMNATFIYVTHDQEEALTMSDKVGVMMAGELLQVDSPVNIYHQPNDIRVAKFIGSPQINILPAAVEENGIISICGRKLAKRSPLPTGTPLQAGIRPSTLQIKSLAADVEFEGKIRHLENIGSDIYLHVEIAGSDLTVIARVSSMNAEDYKIDANIALGASAEHIMFFDQHGKRLRNVQAANSIA
jgi:multiple sugar transport system ATP-binding protein